VVCRVAAVGGKFLRDGRRIERISVDQNDYDRFQQGDDIIILAQKGALGVPWVYGVFRE